ncbi:unnamed protein product, partial [Brachionus calyciflorus]
MFKLALIVCLIALSLVVLSDTLFVKTCPDDLVFNPSLQLCDLRGVSKSTTPIHEIVKQRPVL